MWTMHSLQPLPAAAPQSVRTELAFYIIAPCVRHARQVEFTVAERKLPPITSFALRMDSGLGAGAAISQANAAAAAAEAVAASQEERCSTVEVALRLLPQLQALAAAHVPGQVLPWHIVACWRSADWLVCLFSTCSGACIVVAPHQTGALQPQLVPRGVQKWSLKLSACMHVQEVEVVYRGLETGQVEAVFKAATPEYLARSYSTGLEDSATGGTFWPCMTLTTHALSDTACMCHVTYCLQT